LCFLAFWKFILFVSVINTWWRQKKVCGFQSGLY
jgi:hypothetical protein